MTADNPDVPLRGSIDLSQLVKPPAAEPAATGDSAAPGTPAPIELTEQNFQDVAQASAQVPVIIVFFSSASPASKELVDRMRTVVGSYQGAFQLATCELESQGAVAGAFQVQAVPTVMGLVAARPMPLFQGNADEQQIRGVLDQALEIARENGVTGTVGGAPAQPPAEPEPEPLPPLHQEAYDAIEREDYAGAIDAYDRALRENPKDADARAGRAQVSLMERSAKADLAQVRQAAADSPGDPQAQMAVADLDVMGGQVEDAFARLIDLVRVTAGDERETVRVRLVELFDVVGDDDPRVMNARRSLAAALF